MDNQWIICGYTKNLMKYFFFQTEHIYVTSTLMRQFIFSLLCLCRQDLFEVFFPGTVSRTLYPSQELVCFMMVYFFRICFSSETTSFSGIVFVKPILFRNCFCQTNPFQELFLSNKSFSGMVFSKIVL